jgi:hypothetical protein
MGTFEMMQSSTISNHENNVAYDQNISFYCHDREHRIKWIGGAESRVISPRMRHLALLIFAGN